MDIQPSPSPTRYAFGNFDEVIVEGTAFRPTYSNANGHVFVRSDRTGVAENFTHEKIAGLVRSGRLQHEKDRFHPAEARKRLENTVAHVSLLPNEAQRRLEVRAAMVEAFCDLEREGKVKRTDLAIKEAMASIQLKAAEYLNAKSRGRKHGGGVGAMPDPVGPRTLRRWLAAYEGFGLAGLADERSKRGYRGSHFTPEEQAILASEVRKFLSPEQPSKSTIAENVKAAFDKLNQERVAQDQDPLRVPSREAVRRAIGRLDPFHADIVRLGLEAARKKHMPVGQGLSLTRPLQRVEMDEWEIDLITVMTDAGLL